MGKGIAIAAIWIGTGIALAFRSEELLPLCAVAGTFIVCMFWD